MLLVGRLQQYVRALLISIIAEVPGCIASVATFAAYAIQAKITCSEGLNVTKAFTSLSIITLTTGPAASLLTAIPSTASSLGCFDRIQAYLLTSPREDKRILLDGTTSQPSQPAPKPQPSDNGIELSNRYNMKTSSLASASLVVEDVTLRPSQKASVVLENISFNVTKGSILMIAGPVGAGKTTLLKALLGEINCDSGKISTRTTRISYCAQSPWLSNCSIQQNICGPIDASSAIDETWYQAVVHACALEPDISALEEGDRTIVGSKGLTLSGGQRQRIALARALYARNELFVLDDVFSALDGSTERIVFERAFGKNGLLR